MSTGKAGAAFLPVIFTSGEGPRSWPPNALCSPATDRKTCIENSITRGVDCISTTPDNHQAHTTTSDRIQWFYSSTALEPHRKERQDNLGLRRRVGCLICHKVAEKEKHITVLCDKGQVIRAQGLSPTLAYFWYSSSEDSAQDFPEDQEHRPIASHTVPSAMFHPSPCKPKRT